jgi:CheY-like chemotaxis protein
MCQQKRVLVVDDDNMVRELMRDALSVQGYVVQEASDGVDALKQVRETPFDAIVLDVQMPKMDGWEFLDSYQRLHDRHARVVVCSAIASHDPRMDHERVAGYLAKPFALDELYRCVKRCIGSTRVSAAGSAD